VHDRKIALHAYHCPKNPYSKKTFLRLLVEPLGRFSTNQNFTTENISKPCNRRYQSSPSEKNRKYKGYNWKTNQMQSFWTKHYVTPRGSSSLTCWVLSQSVQVGESYPIADKNPSAARQSGCNIHVGSWRDYANFSKNTKQTFDATKLKTNKQIKLTSMGTRGDGLTSEARGTHGTSPEGWGGTLNRPIYSVLELSRVSVYYTASIDISKYLIFLLMRMGTAETVSRHHHHAPPLHGSRGRRRRQFQDCLCPLVIVGRSRCTELSGLLNNRWSVTSISKWQSPVATPSTMNRRTVQPIYSFHESRAWPTDGSQCIMGSPMEMAA